MLIQFNKKLSFFYFFLIKYIYDRFKKYKHLSEIGHSSHLGLFLEQILVPKSRIAQYMYLKSFFGNNWSNSE